MHSYGITIPQLCDLFQVSEHVFKREVGQANLKSAKSKAIGMLANKAFQIAMEGDKAMLMFLLKTQARWSESRADLEIKLEHEKNLIEFKQNIGYVEHAAAPINIQIVDAHTADYERNAIDFVEPAVLGLPDTE